MLRCDGYECLVCCLLAWHKADPVSADEMVRFAMNNLNWIRQRQKEGKDPLEGEIENSAPGGGPVTS